jgi:hypothetical protein
MRRVSDPALYVFNAAISTDRLNDGATAAFGDGVVIGVNTSSATTFEAIQMVSKVGDAPQSGLVLVKSSDAADEDFSCGGGEGNEPCRWGDYAAATPDPSADPSGVHGVVWLTSMWTTRGTAGRNYWRTWNWSAIP